jgi:hypothetical protein
LTFPAWLDPHKRERFDWGFYLADRRRLSTGL